MIMILIEIPGGLRTVMSVRGDNDRGRGVSQGYACGGGGTAPTPRTNLNKYVFEAVQFKSIELMFYQDEGVDTSLLAAEAGCACCES